MLKLKLLRFKGDVKSELTDSDAHKGADEGARKYVLFSFRAVTMGVQSDVEVTGYRGRKPTRKTFSTEKLCALG